jgi:hypothetical protein
MTNTTQTDQTDESEVQCIAFAGDRRIACGPLDAVALAVKAAAEAQPQARILLFNAQTSEPIELDWRGSVEEVLGRLAGRGACSPATAAPQPQPAGPGRPRLGVVAREVTLLPRHWAWLNCQPGGASVALRKLVEQARRASASADQVRQSQNATYQFMTAMAGDLDGYEDAARALFAGNRAQFEALLAAWPEDIRAHLAQLAGAAFAPACAAESQDV